MQISIHEVENQIYVSIVLSSDHILQSNDVLMPIQLLQENDLSESPLSVCSILESIEVFLESNDVFRFFIYSFPHDTISSLAYIIC